MSQTPFSNKVEILGQFWFFYKEEAQKYENWRDFLTFADVGLPMAYLAWQEMVTIKPNAKKYVDETWDVFCEILNLDANTRYGSLEEIFDASPNEPINAEG